MGNADDFITEAIGRGAAEGLASLTGVARLVYLISEAEVRCDMDGIDSFVAAFGSSGVGELAAAYSAIGAEEIASALLEIAGSLPEVPDALLTRANDRITSRAGYGYDDIKLAVIASLHGGR